MDAAPWLTLFDRVVDEIRDGLDGFDRWGDGGDRSDNYALDLVADARALAVLADAGVPVLSEESGLTAGDGDAVVVIDPVDGSTNASRGIPHYATSLCVVSGGVPEVGLVVNLATGERFEAVRGGGATRNGEPISPTGCVDLSDAIVATAGFPPAPLGSRQVRAFGAAALDISAVACGRLDGFVDPFGAHSVWDYAAAVLVCEEAGVAVGELQRRDLIELDVTARRGPIVGATPELCEALIGRLAG